MGPDHIMLDTPLAWLDSVVESVSPNGFLTPVSDSLSLSSSASPNIPLSSFASSPSDDSHSPNQTFSLGSSSSRSSQSAQASSPRGAPSGPTNVPRRRIRPKIALDPSQPLTARGKPRARVYVACDQCRIRKTRCDGAKPVCFNCHKRPPEVGDCSYDAQPKRRGQDKVPGMRVRSSTGHRSSKRRRNTTDNDEDEDDDDSNSDTSTRESFAGSEYNSTSHLRGSYENFPGQSSDESAEEYDPFPLVDLDPPSGVVAAEYDFGRYWEKEQRIPSRPGLQFTRDTWWDALLSFYSTDDGTSDVILLTPEQRSSTVLRVVADLRALFRSSLCWVSFINLPRFFDTLLNPASRGSMQPSLVLAALAMGLFTQSSEAERGPAGRAKSLKLLDLAHSTLQASLSSGWVDVGLIQAAWLIAYFELQSHPMRSSERNRSAMLLLDSLIRLFSLTTLDSDIKRSHTANRPSIASLMNGNSYSPTSQEGYSPQTNPAYLTPSVPGFIAQLNAGQRQTGFGTQTGPQSVVPSDSIIPENIASTAQPPACCNCPSQTLAHNWPGVRGIAPLWAATPVWPENVSEAEFKKEECRRLVWASVMITANHNSYTSPQEEIDRNKLWIKNPENQYALLFPSESLALLGTPTQTNDVWTLFLRSMLLLHGCVRKRGDLSLSDAERAQFAMYAWLEMDAIENAMNQHTCELEYNFGFQAREMLFSARMCVSHEFQRYIPQVSTNGRLFYRDKAEAWLKRRLLLAKELWQDHLAGLSSPTLDMRRSLLVYWYMSHVIKALALWDADPTLRIALDAAKSFAKPTEYFMMFWPSVHQRQEWQEIRFALISACLKAGVAPPETTLPGPLPRAPNVQSKTRKEQRT